MLAQRGQDLLNAALAPFPSLRAVLSPWDVTQTPQCLEHIPGPSARSPFPERLLPALPNAGCELLLSFRTSANKKGTKLCCAPVSNSPTCLPGQPIPLLLLAGSAAWPPTLPST